MSDCVCPECKRELRIEEIVGRDVTAAFWVIVRKQPVLMQGAIMSYLGLFRGTRLLTDAKSLQIVTEVLALDADVMRLANAMLNTVDNIRNKDADVETDSKKPKLSNHNYLKKVLSSTPATVAVLGVESKPRLPVSQSSSKVIKGLQSLMGDD